MPKQEFETTSETKPAVDTMKPPEQTAEAIAGRTGLPLGSVAPGQVPPAAEQPVNLNKGVRKEPETIYNPRSTAPNQPGVLRPVPHKVKVIRPGDSLHGQVLKVAHGSATNVFCDVQSGEGKSQVSFLHGDVEPVTTPEDGKPGEAAATK